MKKRGGEDLPLAQDVEDSTASTASRAAIAASTAWKLSTSPRTELGRRPYIITFSRSTSAA
jgi:hypothetical protein